MIKKWIKCILGFCLSGLRFWNLGFNLKGEIMLKSAKLGLQGTWAPRGWRLGHSGDLGAQTVAPKCCFWVVWLATMVSMLFSESKGFLLGEF